MTLSAPIGTSGATPVPMPALDPGDSPLSPSAAARARALPAALLVAGAITSSRIALANVFLVLLLVAAWLAWRKGAFSGLPTARSLTWPIATFCFASLVSAALSLDPLESIDALPRLVVFMLIPLSAALLDRTWWPRLVAGLALVTTVLAVWGIVQYLGGADNLENRITGPLAHYMLYAGWLLLAVLTLSAVLVLSHEPRRWWLVAPVLLGTLAIFLSFTRNAWVGLAAGVLVLAAVWRRRLLLVYPVLAVVVWLALPAAVLDRAFSTFDLHQSANYDRLCMAQSGMQMIRDHPFAGVGLNMVPRVYPLYRRDDAPRWRVPHLHNNPLQIAAERGLPALAAYLWLIGAFATTTWRGLRRVEGRRRIAAAASLAAVVGITVAGLFEYNFWSAPVQYFTFVLLGLGPGSVAEEES